jgi:hypothetical protein
MGVLFEGHDLSYCVVNEGKVIEYKGQQIYNDIEDAEVAKQEKGGEIYIMAKP